METVWLDFTYIKMLKAEEKREENNLGIGITRNKYDKALNFRL